MTTAAWDGWCRGFLDIAGFEGVDSSLNGLQVDNDGAEVETVAFAVDASLEAFKRAKEAGAGLVFVHHGLFWGKPLRLAGAHRERVRFLLEANIALYACHLPLDAHPEVGNNACLARLLGMTGLEPFGMSHGLAIGWRGRLAEPLSVDGAARRIAFMNRPPQAVLPFGKSENVTCACISGGAAMQALDAIDAGVDLYVTGEAGHSVYHQAREAALNMIAGGHYSTEVWGVRAVMEKCAREMRVGVEFLDIPTGL